jgi:hypothetical protein
MLYQEVSQQDLKDTYAFSFISISLMFSLGKPVTGVNYTAPVVVNPDILSVFVFAVAMQYYDACQVEWYNHALTKSAVAGVSWIWLHVPMSLFLFGVGANLKVLIHGLQTHHLPAYNAQVWALSPRM